LHLLAHACLHEEVKELPLELGRVRLKAASKKDILERDTWAQVLEKVSPKTY
jgi:hypothetical protein